MPHQNDEIGMDGNTQDTSHDTISTTMDSDVEGDTIDTQHTQATELSQAMGSERLSHAERLRLRLRVALFKVQTHQINIPLSQLRIPTHRPHDRNVSADLSSEHAHPPRLLPAPVIEPGRRPAQTVTQPRILSSPPSSTGASSVKNSSPEVFLTPALPPKRVQSVDQAKNSPDREKGCQSDIEAGCGHSNSSSVRISAAGDLLGLRESVCNTLLTKYQVSSGSKLRRLAITDYIIRTCNVSATATPASPRKLNASLNPSFRREAPQFSAQKHPNVD
ncbi:MAG: hypothetical protein Q9219_005017 [cf. Caloplaca sp. 3 TL-2023]